LLDLHDGAITNALDQVVGILIGVDAEALAPVDAALGAIAVQHAVVLEEQIAEGLGVGHPRIFGSPLHLGVRQTSRFRAIAW